MAGVRVAIVTESFLPTGNGVTTSVCRILEHLSFGPVGRGAARAAWRWVRRLHCLADLTLAPSTAALEDLRAHGIPRTALWARGVDTAQFHPGWRRTPAPEPCVAPSRPTARSCWGTSDASPRRRSCTGWPRPRRSRGRAWSSSATVRAAGMPVRAGALTAAVERHARPPRTGLRLDVSAAATAPAGAGLAPARGGPLDLVEHRVSGFLFDPGAGSPRRTPRRSCRCRSWSSSSWPTTAPWRGATRRGQPEGGTGG